MEDYDTLLRDMAQEYIVNGESDAYTDLMEKVRRAAKAAFLTHNVVDINHD